MNKGMIIFDKPSKCTKCPCCSMEVFLGYLTCKLTNNIIMPGQSIPDNCPIISLDQEQMDTILSALQKRMKG